MITDNSTRKKAAPRNTGGRPVIHSEGPWANRLDAANKPRMRKGQSPAVFDDHSVIFGLRGRMVDHIPQANGVEIVVVLSE